MTVARSFGRVADELVGLVGLDQVQDPAADQQAEGQEHHGLADRGGPQPPRHRAIGDQQKGIGGIGRCRWVRSG
jgi:hypothetical protein